MFGLYRWKQRYCLFMVFITLTLTQSLSFSPSLHRHIETHNRLLDFKWFFFYSSFSSHNESEYWTNEKTLNDGANVSIKCQKSVKSVIHKHKRRNKHSCWQIKQNGLKRREEKRRKIKKKTTHTQMTMSGRDSITKSYLQFLLHFLFEIYTRRIATVLSRVGGFGILCAD